MIRTGGNIPLQSLIANHLPNTWSRIKSIHAKRFPMLTAGLLIISFGALLSPSITEFLQLDRYSVTHVHNYWRVLTGHLVHWNPNHFFWDGLVFLVLATICELHNRRHYWVLLAVSAFTISLGMLTFDSGMSQYRGLSGIDTALFAYWIMITLQGRWRRCQALERIVYIGTLAALAGKTIYEYATGSAIFVENVEDFAPAPLAHLLGFTTGFVAASFSNRKTAPNI